MQKEKESAASTPVKDSVEAQKLRVLENRLEKAITKCNETTHISKTYQFVVQKFEEVLVCLVKACVRCYILKVHTVKPR